MVVVNVSLVSTELHVRSALPTIISGHHVNFVIHLQVVQEKEIVILKVTVHVLQDIMVIVVSTVMKILAIIMEQSLL